MLEGNPPVNRTTPEHVSDDYALSAFAPLADAGFLPDLLPGIPHNAALSRLSKLKADKLGKIPGRQLDDGTWVGFGKWRQHATTQSDLSEWSTWPDVSVCINARRIAAIDVDVLDADLADRIEARALAMLGPAPCRIGQAPKRLLVYRVGSPVAKVRLAFTKGGVGHAVEILGDGQHFVAEGIHAKTREPYTWPRGDLASVGYDGLTLTDLDKIRAFLAAVEGEAERRGYEITGRGDAKPKGAMRGRAAPSWFEPDMSCNVDRVVAYLRDEKPAVAGAGGEPHTLVVANKCLDLGAERDMACDLMLEHWSPRCMPPWDGEDLREKVEHAYDYRDNAIGCDAVQPAAETFKDAAAKLAEPSEQQQNDGRAVEHRPFRLLKRSDYRNLPPQRWLFDKLLPEVGVVLLVGHSQALKSFVMLDIGAAVASGARAFGSHSPSQTGAVVYVAGEGQYGIKAQRVPAWERERRVSLDAWPFYLVENMPLAQDADAIEALADEIGKAVGSDPVRLIVLDTLAHMSGSLKENDSELKLCGIVAVRLSRRFSCCVVIIHHPPKSEDSEKANPRGSKANYEIADAVIGAFRQEDAGEILTKLVVDKQKDGERGYTLWLGAKVIELGRNAAGQPVSSLVLHMLDQGAAEALKVSTEDRLDWATAALKSLAGRGDTTVTAGRLARVMRGMKDPTVPQDGRAGTPDQEREIESLRRALCRSVGGERWRHLARKAGSKRNAEWLFSLPQAQGGEL